jgi:hypothetical protein
VYLTKNRFGVYLICYRDDDGKEHRVSSHTRIKKVAYGKFSKFNIPKEPNRKPDYKSILAHIQATRSAKTYRMYKDIIQLFDKSSGKSFQNITPADYQKYCVYRGHLSPGSLSIELRTLKAFFNQAKRWQALRRVILTPGQSTFSYITNKKGSTNGESERNETEAGYSGTQQTAKVQAAA